MHVIDMYAQIAGTPMGLPMSGFFGEAVAEAREKICLPRIQPKHWLMYANETFVIARCSNVEEIQNNQEHPKISTSLRSRRTTESWHSWRGWLKGRPMAYWRQAFIPDKLKEIKYLAFIATTQMIANSHASEPYSSEPKLTATRRAKKKKETFSSKCSGKMDTQSTL